MSDDTVPEPFEQQLRATFGGAADHVDGAAVTRVGVAGAVARRRRRAARRRALTGLAAAAVVLVGLLVVRAGSDGHQEQVLAGAPSTTTTVASCASGSPGEHAGWFRLSEAQAAALVDAGAITQTEADGRASHAVLLDHADLPILSKARLEPIGQQLWDLGYEDSAGLGLLRAEDRLTPDQEAAIDDGIAPVLSQAQVDRIFAAFPSLTAIAAGGQPFPTVRDGVSFAPSDTAVPSIPSGCPAGPR